MRKIMSGLFISLDGVVEDPQTWHFPYYSDAMGAAVRSQIADADTMLMGRRTYESFGSSWGHRSSDVPFTDEINAIPKLVASTKLFDTPWNNTTLIKGDLGPALQAIKDGPGGTISVAGSVGLVRSLLSLGLLDELDLLVHPIIVGKGMRLFESGTEPYPLTLTHSQTIENGVLNLTYVPVRS